MFGVRLITADVSGSCGSPSQLIPFSRESQKAEDKPPARTSAVVKFTVKCEVIHFDINGAHNQTGDNGHDPGPSGLGNESHIIMRAS